MNRTIRTMLVGWLGCMLASTLSIAATAGTYPNKPVTLVVVFGPGGTSDVAARIVGQALSAELKQQVVVENRPGAGGNIGASMASRAKSDGYTLLAAFPGLTTNGALYSKLDYDPVKDFAPISLMASAPNVIVISPALPIHSLQEFIAYAKSKPGQLNYGSAGAGSSSHLAGALLNEKAGLNLQHIPYKGGAPALTDLASGRLDVMLIPLPEALAMIKGGKVKAIALAGKQRSKVLPDLPTTKEAGLADFEVGSWYGLMAPANTPDDIMDTLSTATSNALKYPKVKEAFDAQGIEMVASTPAQFQSFLHNERDRWSAVIKANQIKLD